MPIFDFIQAIESIIIIILGMGAFTVYSHNNRIKRIEKTKLAMQEIKKLYKDEYYGLLFPPNNYSRNENTNFSSYTEHDFQQSKNVFFVFSALNEIAFGVFHQIYDGRYFKRVYLTEIHQIYRNNQKMLRELRRIYNNDSLFLDLEMLLTKSEYNMGASE